MSEDRWRARLRWVVAHPRDPQVLLARRDGALVLPETERLGRVWTADRGRGPPGPARAARRRRLLLDYLDDHEDPAAQAQRAARGPAGYLFFDWTDACVAHPFLDLATIRRGTAFTDLTRRTSCASGCARPTCRSGPPSSRPGRLERVWELAPRWVPSTRRSATGPWPPSRPWTPIWPRPPPGGCARCWPVSASRRP